MSDVEFKDKFVAFLDVIGFKKLVEAAEAGNGRALNEVVEVLNEFGSPEQRRRFEKYGPKVCPETSYVQRNLDFRVTHISDCLVVSSEISRAGVINLVSHCSGVVISLMKHGIMCRGYITRGPVFHTDTQFIGTGYQRAYENEAKVSAFKREADERGTPFVEVDGTLCDYVSTSEDACVKEMFSRFVKGDGEVVALFPFQLFAHSFFIGGFGRKFDADKERRSNQNVRLIIEHLKERVLALVDVSNPSAVRKAEHYIRALDDQLAVCDETDEVITWMS